MPEPTFILSFDCEGKWGAADHLGRRARRISDAALCDAHARLLELLGAHRVGASFAFVAALLGERAEIGQFLRDARAQHPRYAAWLGSARDGIAASPGGWFVPALAAMTLAAGSHELASHGGTHAPLDEQSCSAADFDTEMRLVRGCEARLGLHSETLVFPRNRGGHRARLAGFGFRAYRLTHPLEAGRSLPARLRRLACEWLPPAAAAHADSASTAAIPPGLILNFALGLRRLVPRRVTARRLRALLLDSAARNGVAHVYSHPNDFIADPGLYGSLARLLGEAAELRERGRLQVRTQAQYLAGWQAA